MLYGLFSLLLLYSFLLFSFYILGFKAIYVCTYILSISLTAGVVGLTLAFPVNVSLFIVYKSAMAMDNVHTATCSDILATLPLKFKDNINARYGPGTHILVRQLEKKMLLFSRCSNHLTFLCKCRENKVVPQGLCLKAPVNSTRASNITYKASLSLLKERISYHHSQKSVLYNEISELQLQLETKLSKIDFDRIYFPSQIWSRNKVFNTKRNKSKNCQF